MTVNPSLGYLGKKYPNYRSYVDLGVRSIGMLLWGRWFIKCQKCVKNNACVTKLILLFCLSSTKRAYDVEATW